MPAESKSRACPENTHGRLASALSALFLLGLLFPVAPSFGQTKFQFGLGYNVSYVNVDTLNWILDEFHENNPQLEREFTHPRWMQGFTFDLGLQGGRTYFGLGMIFRRNKTEAFDEDPSGLQQQWDLKSRLNLFIAMVSYRPVDYVGIGASLDLGNARIRTRTAPMTIIRDEEWETVVKESNLGASFYLEFFVPISRAIWLQLKPYYQWAFIDVDYSNLHFDLNPANAVIQPGPHEDRPSHFGGLMQLVWNIY